MRDLSDLELVVITEVICGPGGCVGKPGTAWSPRRRLALISSETTVAGLVRDGWLDRWDDLDALTLSPWAAERMGVRLECGEDEAEPYWVEVTAPERQPRMPRWTRQLGSLEHLPQPRRREEDEGDAERKKKPPALAGGLGRILGIPLARGRKPGRSLAG